MELTYGICGGREGGAVNLLWQIKNRMQHESADNTKWTTTVTFRFITYVEEFDLV